MTFMEMQSARLYCLSGRLSYSAAPLSERHQAGEERFVRLCDHLYTGIGEYFTNSHARKASGSFAVRRNSRQEFTQHFPPW